MYVLFGYGPLDMLTCLGMEDQKSEAILEADRLKDHYDVHQCARIYWTDEHEMSAEEVEAFELLLESLE